MGSTENIPIGREAVVTALLRAAADEFAERGFESASIRAIATRAGVNHGLVHRHFGSKSQLLTAVLADLSDKVASDVATGSRLDTRSSDATQLFLRVLARSLLDGADVAGQARHPVMDWAVNQAVDRTGADPAAVRVGVAQSIALELGWLLFEPFLIAAADLDAAELASARDGIQEVQRALVDRSRSASTPPK
ncbi:TetR family transcriptional regulator [Antricoccus suffuscus]|uniref:TetR family transcriptional regulator n=1 Tax=Antricoccus suffuscus TaxID=1629062 RepID=A0A2T0ZWG4_9ACTN|nr:TetR/AcrR family transcriptional regulator [Antricoccus suffuscus]PRZ40428.1 TetR family transcriptional regulator [Antricoccus suffuscus]